MASVFLSIPRLLLAFRFLIFLNTLYNLLLIVAPQKSRSFLTMLAIALNFARPSRDHPLPCCLVILALNSWKHVLGHLDVSKCIVLMVNALYMWQQHKRPHWTYRHVFLIVGRQCSNQLRKSKSRVSVALICTTDDTCTSAYLFDVISVLCLPTSRIVIKHNQQECFVADWQHKPHKKRWLEPQCAAILASLFHARLDTTQGAYKSINWM